MKTRRQEDAIISTLDFERIMHLINVTEEENPISIENLQQLKRKVLTAKKVNPQEMLANIVTMGSLVEIKTDYDDFTFKIELVYPEFENVRENKVSVFSNLGTAIFLQKANDIISYYTWNKEHTIKILNIFYQSEAAGDFNS
ncbi:MAG: GreA/GreB family elongation factor [Draconibacterium sp.]